MFVGGDLTGINAIAATCTVPSYKASVQHPLAQGKVRFVGELVAMTVAPTRAAAEDLAEQVELDLDELPALVDAHAARRTTDTRVHEDWDDNLFLTLNYDNGFEEHARNAPVVVEREMTMSRQAMVPLEGKAIVADWDYRADQLIVYTSTQVPHVIRIGLAQCLGIEEGRIRVIAPDVGGGFGYKCVLQPEEICVAWLALTYRRPFRYVEDRREHLIAGANSRQHHYRLKAYADQRGRLLALDAEITIDGGAYSNWPFTVALEPGQATGNLPGPYDFRGYRCRTYCVATNKPGFLPYRGVARTSVCFAIELLIDAIAREVGREPWEVRLENLVTPAAMPYDNVSRKHYDSGDYPQSLETVRREIDLDKWRARQKQGEKDGRRIGIGFATYCEQSAHGTSVFAAWGLPLIPGYDQATVRMLPDGSLEVRVGVHSHGQGMETTLAQIAHEVLGVDIAKYPRDPRRHGCDAVLDRHLCLAQHCHDRRRRRENLRGAGATLSGDRCASDAVRDQHRQIHARARRRPAIVGLPQGDCGSLVPASATSSSGCRCQRPGSDACTSRRSTPAPSATPRTPRSSRSIPTSAASKFSITSLPRIAAAWSIR